MKKCVYCGVDLEGASYGFDYDENFFTGFYIRENHPSSWLECTSCSETFRKAYYLMASSKEAISMMKLKIEQAGQKLGFKSGFNQ